MQETGQTGCSKGHQHQEGHHDHQAPLKPKVFFVLGGIGVITRPWIRKRYALRKFGPKAALCPLVSGRFAQSRGKYGLLEMGRKSENATLINDYINKGQIVPVAITISLIKAAMHENGWEVSLTEPESEIPYRRLSKEPGQRQRME